MNRQELVRLQVIIESALLEEQAKLEAAEAEEASQFSLNRAISAGYRIEEQRAALLSIKTEMEGL